MAYVIVAGILTVAILIALDIFAGRAINKDYPSAPDRSEDWRRIEE